MEHVQSPLFRNGYALVLSSAVTSGLGVIYWILAARNYSTEVVGLNSAALSAILFVASLSQLNLTSALNRFIPAAGSKTRRLVLYSIFISVAAALVASILFELGVDIWAPTLDFIDASPFIIPWFTLAVMAWCIFMLQDAALTGLRQATWVPIENTFFAVLKIVILLAAVEIAPKYGVLLSWLLPLLITIPAINWLLFRRLIPQHERVAAQVTTIPPTPTQIGRFIAGDYLGSLIWYATTNLVPVLVAVRAGASANAYFYLSWTIAYSFYLVSLNMGQSLIAEGATDLTKLDAYGYRMFIQTARLLVPAVAIVFAGAPYILSVFGVSYSAEGTTLLRLLSLSALPNIVTSLYISVARVERRMKQVVLVLGILSLMVLSLGFLLMDLVGITGIGIAWLTSQTIMAIVLLTRTNLRTVWLAHLNTWFLERATSWPRTFWWHLRRRHRVAAASRLIGDILPTIPPPPDTPAPATWSVQTLVRTVNDVMVVTLGPSGHPPTGILKLAYTRSAAESLHRQQAALRALHAEDRLGEWRALLPTILAESMAPKSALPGGANAAGRRTARGALRTGAPQANEARGCGGHRRAAPAYRAVDHRRR